MSDLVERVARLFDPRAWESGIPLLSQRRRQARARHKARAAIAAVRAADVERGPSDAEIEDAARHLWDELPGEAYHDYEVGPVAVVWDEARHESQVTYRGVTTDILQTAAKVRAEEVTE